MKKIILLVVLVSNSLISCAQESLNKVIVDENFDVEILIGKVNEEGLSNYDIFSYADEYYEEYEVDEDLLTELKAKSEDVEIKVVFGSWCGDSQANVPAFQKVIDHSGIDKSKIEYIAVNGEKTGGDVIDITDLKVEYVPTFIFYKDGKEIGRIVESPRKSIEKDMLKILK